MTTLDRPDGRATAKSAKRARRREEIADAAIDALTQLGYARTSLRDIAEISGVAVGTLHYYFEDKVALIGFCVQRYKTVFVAEIDAILTATTENEALVRNVIRGLALSLRRNPGMHRLWYDFRSQAMFDPAFAGVASEIDTSLTGVVERLLLRLGLPGQEALAAYLMLDAAFRFFLQRFLAGDDAAPAEFEQHLGRHFGHFLAGLRAGDTP